MLIFAASGKLFDLLRSYEFTSLTNLRKIFNTIGKLMNKQTPNHSIILTCYCKIWFLFIIQLNRSGFVAPCLCLYCLHLLGPNDVAGHIIMFTTSMAVHEIAICGGFYFSHPDIAGPFAGSVFGITNTMAQIPGFVNPMLVAYLTPNVSNLMIHQENCTLI